MHRTSNVWQFSSGQLLWKRPML